MLNSVLVMF